MRHQTQPFLYWEDRLVRRIRHPNGKLTHHGKRVGRDCPLTAEERRAYVQSGIVRCVKIVSQRRKLGLRDAYDLVKAARGGKTK